MHLPQGVGVRRYYTRRENSDIPRPSGTFYKQSTEFPTLSRDSDLPMGSSQGNGVATLVTTAQVHTDPEAAATPAEMEISVDTASSQEPTRTTTA